MIECRRCGFMNPEKADYCIKCRFLMTEGRSPKPREDGDKPGGLSGGGSPSKPDITPPSPDLDDAFAGRSMLDVGGYGIGGTAPGDVYGPPPSDAYAVMTGKYDTPPKKKRGFSRRKRSPLKRKQKPPARKFPHQGPPGGKVTRGLPPPLTTGGAPAAPGVRPRAGPRTLITKRPRPSMPRPDAAVLARVGEFATPRNVMTAIAGVLVLLALIFAVTGGGYFSSQESGQLDGSAAAMRRLPSVHMSAEMLLNSEKKGTVSVNLQVNTTSGGDLRATYTSVSSVRSGVTEYIRSGGAAYVSEDGGAWEPAEGPGELDLSLGSIFSSASGVRQVNKEPVGGVECDHMSFSGGSDFLTGLIPGSEATTTTRVYTEVWIDPKDNYVRHVRIDASDLEVKGLGRCDCHLEADFSNFGIPLEITPPV
ncbi:MAG: hypothetical protein KKH73_04145 [Actinobacteria bacterium]|nr:hypothetical protein [Actinomycetota bacterium]